MPKPPDPQQPTPPPPPELTTLASEHPAAAAAPPPFPLPAAMNAAAEPNPNMATVPGDLQQELIALETWAMENKKEARRNTLAFWSLKLPAILTSLCAGIAAQFDLAAISTITGSVAGVCIIIDGVHPQGMLRNVHLRAYYDIRLLSNNMMSDWRSGDHDEQSARAIIQESKKERQRISTYIRDAETSLRYKNEH